MLTCWRCLTNAILDVIPSTATVVETDRTYQRIGIANRPTKMPIDLGVGI